MVGPGSVDIIATMPPTARGGVGGGVYGDLGRFAAHALRPGGVLLTRAASLHVGGADADPGNVALAKQALENEVGQDEAADVQPEDIPVRPLHHG